MTDFEYLARILKYESTTGRMYWRVSSGRMAACSEAGSIDGYGYVRITVRMPNGKRRNLACHRVAWLLEHGYWPTMEIDHINGDRSDNRLSNLRDVSRSVNMANRSGPDRDSKTGWLGVSLHRGGRYKAMITRRGVRKHLGVFDTPQEAHAAYCSASAVAA